MGLENEKKKYQTIPLWHYKWATKKEKNALYKLNFYLYAIFDVCYFTLKANFPTHNLNFYWWDRIQATFWKLLYFVLLHKFWNYFSRHTCFTGGDGIESRLPFKIFSTLLCTPKRAFMIFSLLYLYFILNVFSTNIWQKNCYCSKAIKVEVFWEGQIIVRNPPL